jgi:hypothetical protein
MGWTFYNASGQQLKNTGTIALTQLDIDGGTDIGAAIIDADLFIIDDGAGGTNRKTAASRIVTYVDAELHPEQGSKAMVKVWCQVASGGALVVPDIGVSTVGDTAVGLADINFTVPFTSRLLVLRFAQTTQIRWL